MFSELSILDIHSKLLRDELDPYDVVNETIFKYEKYDSLYRSWVSFDKQALLDGASKVKSLINNSQDLRPLECMPVGVKDIINTIDFPTQMGSSIWKNFTPGNDARIIYNIKNKGALVAGKTVTAEFAVHALNETLNPHNIEMTPGTSSSGSAVAVALGMVPFSIGTQTAGSIIRPASFCGVYGVKPSFGLIPRTGMLKTTDSLDTVGFFVSNVKNIKPVFDALRVHGPNYPFSNAALKDPQRQKKINNKLWKIAVVKTNTWSFAEDYAKNSLHLFVEELSSSGNFQIEYADLPLGLDESHDIHKIIYDKTLSYYFKDEFNNKDLLSHEMMSLIESGFSISVEGYYNALAKQDVLIKKMDDFFIQYDIVIALSTAGQAPMRNVTESPDPALIWTLCHLPVLNVPMFISPDKMPFGIQVAARKYNDLLLFDFIDNLYALGVIPKSSNPKLNR
jgi:Asp-tRNA(Asn)/Glu-tRNA(Gln) amidotransferase A subunit family amidase